MSFFLPLFLMFAGPFWQEKTPADWTDIEVSQMFVDSPWAANASLPPRAGPAPAVQLYIATAGPMMAAEKERAKRVLARRKPGQEVQEDALEEEYQAWLEDNRTTQVVVAIRIGTTTKMSEEIEIKHMEDESFMQAGRRKVKMTGHFPPSSRDPHLRMAFPRIEGLDEKATVTFGLYIPGLPMSFREVQFKVKDLTLNGKLEW